MAKNHDTETAEERQARELINAIARRRYSIRMADPTAKEKKRANGRRWRKANPEKCAEFTKRWRSRNPDVVRDSHRAWASKNRSARAEYMRRWGANHRDERRKYARDRHESDPEKRPQTWASWYSKNKERRLAYHKKRHADHPEICREKQRKHLPKPTRPCPELCECCGKPPAGKQSMCLDHCHETHTFRGWLCGRCNRAIGQLGDNLLGIQQASTYLRKALKAAKRKK